MVRGLVLSLALLAASAGFGGADGAMALSVNGHVLTEEELGREVAPLLTKIPTNQWDAARKGLRMRLARSFLTRNALVDAAKAATSGSSVAVRWSRRSTRLRSLCRSARCPIR